MANEKGKALPERTILVQVAPRKSVEFDGQTYGPGKQLEIPESEAKSLYQKGFIVEPDDDDDDDQPVAGSGPTVAAGSDAGSASTGGGNTDSQEQ